MPDQRLRITNAICEARVDATTRIFDEKCKAMYIDKVPGQAAVFYVRPYCRIRKKQVRIMLGVFSIAADDPAQRFDTDKARLKAETIVVRAKDGLDVVAEHQAVQAQRAVEGILIEALVTEFIDHLKEPIAKTGYAHKVPRKETWANDEGYLKRHLLPVYGHRVASTVRKGELATLLRDVAKASNSNARALKTVVTKMFEYAAEAGREYIDASPAVNLPKLDKPKAKSRVLTAAEIRKFWLGLDHPDCPGDRASKLALKAILCSMLRPKEIVLAMRDEQRGQGTDMPYLHIPFIRVKKRRDILQPVNSLLSEIIRSTNGMAIFSGNDPDQPLQRHTLSQLLRGKPATKTAPARIGICAFLGIDPFTPHDLRRTAATLAGDVQQTQANIALCLDHQDKGEHGAVVPSVTGEVYALSHRLPEKKLVLDAIDAALRQIIADQPVTHRLAA